MTQKFQDAMAIVRTYGRPDLFVTFTCNPTWREITENLLPNQSYDMRLSTQEFLNYSLKN